MSEHTKNVTVNPTFGSVCSGIEAASVAWGPLGWAAAWLAEVDPFASSLLAQRYPRVPNLGDMTTLPARIRSGEVHAPGIFCGGTPCQAFSTAGLRNSLSDERGNLSLTFSEIANAIDSRRHIPCIVFWENVPGVLTTKDNAFGHFLAGLAGEEVPLEPPGPRWANAGFVRGPSRTVVWRVLDAQYFGLAQRRKRVFVVASARTDFDPFPVLFEFEGRRRDSAPSRVEGAEVAPTIRAGAANGGLGHGARSGDSKDELIVPVAYGGGSQSPVSVATTTTAHPGGRYDFESETFVGHTLRAMGNAVRRLTPREWERLQGFPDDYTLVSYRGKPAADGPRYKALGNSWAVPVVRWIGARISNQLRNLRSNE